MPPATSLSRPLPPPLPLLARHPLDLDPLDFRRPLQGVTRVASKVGDPPAHLAPFHRPQALNEVLDTAREHLRDPIRVVPATAGSAVVLRGLLSFHAQADGAMVILSLTRRTWQPTKRSEIPAETFDLERMLPISALADGIRRDLYDAVFRSDVAHPAAIRDYVEWAHGAICRELAHDARWKDLGDEALEALGFEPLWVAIARNLPHPPGMPAASLEAYNHVARHALEYESLLGDDEDLVALYSILCEFHDFPANGEPIARLRAFLRSRGLSAALWRSVARGGFDPLAALDPGSSRAFNAAQCLRILRLADRVGPEHGPPPWLIRALLAIGFPFHDVHLDDGRKRAVALARRIAVLHARAEDDTRTAMVEMLPIALDWFDEVRSLSSAAALLDEGSEMHHCVDLYVERCLRGGYFVCSIRCAGDPVERWTASFFLRQDRWHLDAIAGFANAPASERARAVAASVLVWLDDQGRGPDAAS